jgi:hypothetical protein
MPKSTGSLKSVIPLLARTLGVTPAALYERQRVLVRAGLLQQRPGRGPGSGVPANAKSVAMLLISLLATGSLSEVEEQTKVIANLKCRDGRCPVTGKKTFGAALIAALHSETLRKKTFFARATRSGPRAMATIIFTSMSLDEVRTKIDLRKWKKYEKEVRFGADPFALSDDFSALTVDASIGIQTVLRWGGPGGAT